MTSCFQHSPQAQQDWGGTVKFDFGPTGQTWDFLKTAKINKLCLNILFGFTLYEYIYVIRVFFFLLQHLREYCLNFIMLVDDNKDL